MLIVGNGLLITLDSDGRVIQEGAVVIQDGSSAKYVIQKMPKHTIQTQTSLTLREGHHAWDDQHPHASLQHFRQRMALKDPPPGSFLQILERLWWRLDKALGPEDIYISSLVPLIDCIRFGVTTILDHHASAMSVPGSLDECAQAVIDAGIRACLAYEVSDRDGPEIRDQGIKENVRFIKRCRDEADPLLAASFGLHAQMTLSDDTLKKCKKAVEDLDVGFHVHVAEGPEDLEDSLRKSGKRVVERLDSFGILGPKTIACHCVHINEPEMDILLDRNVNVVHNPESNMGNAVGVAPVLGMMEKGVRVGLGTDGYTSDMFEAIKVANMLHKLNEKNPAQRGMKYYYGISE